MTTTNLLFSLALLGLLFFIWINRKDLKKIFYYFMASFDTFSKGASANKISACAGIGVAIYVTKRYTSDDNITLVITIWLLFVLLCLGLVVFKNIVELVQSYKGGNGGKTIIDDKPPLDDILTNKETTSNSNNK